MSDCQQFQISQEETDAIYRRLAAAEAHAARNEALLASLQEQGKAPPGDHKFIFFGDGGERNANQTALVAKITEENPHAIFKAGDNTYTLPGSLSTVTADHAPFEKWRSECRVYPALGNHDLDVEELGQFTYQLYDYLPGNRRYYTVYFKHTGVQLFVLNVGRKSNDYTEYEPDGIEVGSIQYNWLVDKIAASTAKYKIVMFHHPWFSQETNALSGHQYIQRMYWMFEDMGIDLVINGHSHINVRHTLSGLNYVNFSCPVRDCRAVRGSTDVPYVLDGHPAPTLVWKDISAGGNVGVPVYGRISVNASRMLVEAIRISDGARLHCFTITNCNEFPVDDICDYNDCAKCAIPTTGS